MPDSNKPKVGALNHASIPVRNLKEAKRFYTEVLGGEIVLESNPKFAEVRVGGAIIGLSEQEGGWTGPNAEFPHYAFTMTGENFYPFIEHLKANGVRTHHPGTRHDEEEAMYFSAPAGELFLPCWERGLKGADN